MKSQRSNDLRAPISMKQAGTSMSTVPDVLNSKNSTGAVRLGNAVLRSSLALVLIWIGGMKFTSYEAMAIQPLVATSPLMSWLYHVFSVQITSNLLGVAELSIAALILMRPISARAALIGAGAGTLMFLTTLSFMVSVPSGVWAPVHGFPLLAIRGAFLVKDAVLLGSSVAIATESYSALAL
jgi:uncharacterized membrane protein YkgB